jgi:hypothetical protein
MHFFYQKGRNGQLRRAWHYARRLYRGGARWYRALVLPQDIATIRIPVGPQAVVVPLGETALTVVETRVFVTPDVVHPDLFHLSSPRIGRNCGCSRVITQIAT